MLLTATSSLTDWLDYLESIHPVGIDMGLTRVNDVYQRLQLDWSDRTVITVAGTNGKGTTCAFIERAACLLNKPVGVYSSPHINTYNERVRINQSLLSDAQHTAAFAEIERARGDISLTYFEFGTLAGLWLLHQQSVQVVILEVGLGGRLDAINVVDPDIAVITSIGLDHQAYLGSTRALIATEKAGILRPNIPVVMGEADPPVTLHEAVQQHNAKAVWAGVDFGFTVQDRQFHYQSSQRRITSAIPHIPLPNVATAITVIDQLNWPMNDALYQQCIAQTKLTGRLTPYALLSNVTDSSATKSSVTNPSDTNFSDPKGRDTPSMLLDAAHNPQAAEYLAKHIAYTQPKRVYAVCGMMQDKDITGVLQPLIDCVVHWYPASVSINRAADSATIAHHLSHDLRVNPQQISCVEQVIDGVKMAINSATKDDLVLIFGSFFTLSDFYARAAELHSS